MIDTKLFLVFETTSYDGDFIDEDVTKAFHTRGAAEAYVSDLEAADNASEVPTKWVIKEIALG